MGLYTDMQNLKYGITEGPIWLIQSPRHYNWGNLTKIKSYWLKITVNQNQFSYVVGMINWLSSNASLAFSSHTYPPRWRYPLACLVCTMLKMRQFTRLAPFLSLLCPRCRPQINKLFREPEIFLWILYGFSY